MLIGERKLFYVALFVILASQFFLHEIALNFMHKTFIKEKKYSEFYTYRTVIGTFMAGFPLLLSSTFSLMS